MKFQTKVKINFLDFIKKGKFGNIQLGQTKHWILNNFPDPDDFGIGTTLEDAKIWRYGNIEFHFEGNNLFLIFSDYLRELDGGSKLNLDKWIFKNYEKLNLTYVSTQLNLQEIDYCKSIEHFGIRLKTKSQVELDFFGEPATIDLNPAQLNLSSFGLIIRS